MADFFYTDSRQVSHLLANQIDPHLVLAEEIGPAYTEYRQKWEAARTFQEQPPFPLHLDFELKFACNLACPMCLMSLGVERRSIYGDSQTQLPFAKVRALLDEGAAAGLRSVGFGGLWEPLLSKDLPAIIAHARQVGLVDVMVNTNALLLNEELSRALIDSGLTKLMISLDAASATTYAKMRVGSDFKTVCYNIENFLAIRRSLGSRLPLLRLSFCQTALNEGELPDFLARWKGEADFFSVQNYGRYETDGPALFSQNRGAPTPAGRCAQPHKRLLVRHNGDVVPCCDASGFSLVLGNIYRQTLAEIWAGEPLRRLRQSLAGEVEGLTEQCWACQNKF